jgi:hypothetical protein
MKNLAVIFCLFASSSLRAGTSAYELNLDISVRGKHVSSPRLTVKEGEIASITQSANGEKFYLDVIATEVPGKSKNAILMKFVLGTISVAGDKKVIGTPQIISIENNKAEISSGDSSGNEELSLSVVAKRTVL